MRKLRLRIARLALALGVTALAWACNAPFIPIPPPAQTATFSSMLVADDAGVPKTVWIAHGPPNKDAVGARFFVFDRNRMAGVIALAIDDGSFTSPPMDGTMGDDVEISFETPAGALTKSACFQLTTETVPSKDQLPVPTAPSCQ